MELDLIPAEITYGLDRLGMVIQDKPTVFDLEWAEGITWRDVFQENERQFSPYNFEEADVEMLMRHFEDHEREARRLVERGLPLPAYDQILKSNHAFNLLDARGAISVTERAAYIGRVRNLVRAAAQVYLEREEERAAAAV
jgi:glycyl-tRNA synthetase alpha chain